MSTNPYSLVDGLNADAREIRRAFDNYEARITALETDLRIARRGRQEDSLSDAVVRMNEAVVRTTEALTGAGSGIKAGAEVRRRMAIKYSLEHDAEHGEEMFIDAATALIQNNVVYWPEEFGKRTFERLAALPQRARAHAIALIAVAYDISRKEQDDA